MHSKLQHPDQEQSYHHSISKWLHLYLANNHQRTPLTTSRLFNRLQSQPYPLAQTLTQMNSILMTPRILLTLINGAQSPHYFWNSSDQQLAYRNFRNLMVGSLHQTWNDHVLTPTIDHNSWLLRISISRKCARNKTPQRQGTEPFHCLHLDLMRNPFCFAWSHHQHQLLSPSVHCHNSWQTYRLDWSPN